MSPIVRIYLCVMINPPNRVIASVLILLNLAVTIAPHIHVDESVNFGVMATLRSHDCGANEIHKDINDHGFCLLCSRTTQFVAFVVFGLLLSNDKVEFLVVSTSERPYFYAPTSRLFLRGPPALLS